ncbi:hypothetical protein FSP39_024281 [Pinctada imbricata]|uniref:BZIP domain-containing protein n=1 Tax=Pinctada imbricata TaxID=66713 RepID=A0AA88XK96_PINIB|nr:hypothetical protein FSP39_024281 [Pinctada imbricata]
MAQKEDKTLTEPWYISDDIALEIDTSLTTLVSKRKAKRITPESDKDQRYWNKRQRNNVAAKRSRENKRKIEYAIRNKVLVLVEENALLKKEMSVLRSKFGIPDDKSILTEEEREKCIQAAQEGFQKTLGSRKSSPLPSDSCLSPPRGQSPTVHIENLEQNSNLREESSSSDYEMKTCTPVYPTSNPIPCSWSYSPVASSPEPPPAHASIPSSVRDASDNMVMSNAHHNNHWKFGSVSNHHHHHHHTQQYYPPYSHYQPGYYACAPDDNSTSAPADLSLRGSKSSHYENRTSCPHDLNPRSACHAVEPSENAHISGVNSDPLHCENESLRTKLLQLSAQVDEMKALILKS